MSNELINKNLGHATAYAYAVEGGYVGTEEEFAELLGNIAEDLSEIENLSVTVTTLPAGSSATASYNHGVLALGIPKGDKGDKGDTGATGPTGNGISFITKTGTAGSVDTYTITYTNGNTSTFNVTNGEVTEAALAGIIAAEYDSMKTYAVGDFCLHSGALYECTTAITTAEAWNSAHWNQTSAGKQIGSLKGILNDAKLDEVSFEVVPKRTYTINTVDIYKQSFIHFPLTVGKTYTIANKSASAYIAVFSCNADVSGASQDVETLASGLYAGRSTTVTVTQNAKYIRIYCTATPAILEIEAHDTLRQEVDFHEEYRVSKLADSGELELEYILGNTISTGGVIYESSGDNVAYAKVYKGMKLSFFADNSGTMEQATCRVGFFTTVPKGGSSPDISFVNGATTADVLQDCYVAFTRPDKTLFACSYFNNNGVITKTNKIESDLYSSNGTENATTMYPDTAISSSTGYYFTSEGWTAGSILAKKGSSLIFKADGVITNCRYTIFHDSIDYANIVSFGTSYGTIIPDDKDYYIMVSAPADVTLFSFAYEKIGVKERAESYWHGKKIVWFGTSIPAGVVNAGDSNGIGSYPERIGNMLGAKVYNESVGSSRARAGNYELATADDPLGYAGNSPIGILLSLSLSSAEKQSFIDDWDTKWSNIVSDPSSTMSNLTPELIQYYKDTSWDVKLAKYLSGGSIGQCDLYVFDHGFNDAVAPDMFDNFSDDPPTADPTNRGYWLGAMGFLFKKILDDNPKARILIIGHYMNAPTQGTSGQYLIKNGIDKCCAGQAKLAEKWGVPIIKTWEYMRISNNIIDNNGTDMPVLFAYFPDGIHPASDTSGYALQYYAEVLYPRIKDIN